MTHRTKPAKSKIACVMIPDFDVEVCQRHNPHLQNISFAIADNELDSAEIIAANQQARDAGLLLNVTVAQGHILVPDLVVTVRDTDREIEQSNVVYKKLQSLSPFVEESQPGLYFLDASGLKLLYKSDRQFTTKIIATVRACAVPPYRCRVGIGINKFIAQTAANLSEPDRFTIVPSGHERTFLRNLPLAQLQTDPLRLSSDVIASLGDLGLKTIGQAATFPANEMIRRFGPQGEILSRLARGDDTAFFTPETPVERMSETIWLDNPLEQTETILNLVEQMLTPLLTELSRYCQGCATVELFWHHHNKQPTSLIVTVDQPTLSVVMFLRQLSNLLEKEKPGTPTIGVTTPINGITLTIPIATTLFSEQLPLADRLTGSSSSPVDLPEASMITRIIRRDLFLPEQRFVLSATFSKTRPESGDTQPLWAGHCSYSHRATNGLRLYQPAREIKVITENDKKTKKTESNIPVAINRTTVTGQGPWELSGQWWSHHYDRHYWNIQTHEGGHFLIYNDRRSQQWFLQGVFD